MQGYPGAAQPGYPQYPGYAQSPGQVPPGYQGATQYPAAGYGAQPAQYGQPGVSYGQPSAPAAYGATSTSSQPAYTDGAQPQGSYPPVRPDDVNFQLPPNGMAAYLSIDATQVAFNPSNLHAETSLTLCQTS